MLTHEAFINLLKTRYDHFSAPIMAKEILGEAGLEQKDKYEKDDLGKLLQAVKDMGDPRGEAIVGALEEVRGGGAPKAEAKADDKKADDKKDDDKKDDKKAEAKADDKKADDKKADDKKADDKKDTKKGGKKK